MPVPIPAGATIQQTNAPVTRTATPTPASGPVYNAGARMPTSGGLISPDANGTFTPTQGGTMTANISNPSSTATNPAPAVITSNAAATDLANKQTQVNTLNTDTANHNAIVNTPVTPAPTGTDVSDTTTAGTPNGTSLTGTDGTSLDSQVNDILSSFGTQESSINDTANTQEAALADEQTAEQTALDTAATTALGKLNAISSGTYPLSPVEQQILSATTSTFQQALNYQQQANASALGAAKMTMARLGIDTSAPVEALSMISNAIATGTQKITDIGNQMSISLGNLQLGFQKQDYSMVQSSWDETASYMQARVTELQNMQTAVQAAAKNQVDELQSATQMGLTTMIDSAKFTYQQKQDAITNALAQATLSEKQANDLATRAETAQHDRATEAIASFTAGMSGGSGGNSNLPSVSTTANGTPDPVSQAAFLATFPPQVASLIKGIADYTINPSSLPTSKKQAMGGYTQSEISALASQYNPNYDAKSYATRAAMQKSITSGQYSQTITSANTLVQHLAKLQADYAALGNTGAFGQVLNPIKNIEMEGLGSGKVNAVNTDINAVASEAAKIYKGTGAASDQEITSWQNSLSPNATPGQMQAAIQGMAQLMGGKLSTLSDNYSSVMGQPGNFQILTDQSAASLKQLGIDPSTVDPTYGNSPTIKLSNFNGASTANATILKQINQIAPNATPDEVIQMLQSNGYQI